MWANIRPAAKLVAMAILMKQFQFVADEGRPVAFSLDELEAMHLGGRTALRAGLAELERVGMLKRANRGGRKGEGGGGRGNPPFYQIAGDPLTWLSPDDAIRAGLADCRPKVSPSDTFSSPRDTFSVVKVSPRDTPIKTSTTSTSTPSSKGAAQTPQAPLTPLARAATSPTPRRPGQRKRRKKEHDSLANLGEGFNGEQGAAASRRGDEIGGQQGEGR